MVGAAGCAGLAELFAQHCFACHGVSHIRYARLETDLGMAPGTLESDIMLPSNALIHQGMVNAMRSADAAEWFGTARPTGYNNHVFKDVAMPDVLERLQGSYAADGSLIEKGSLSAKQFDRDAADLTAWLQYASDPSKLTREALGPWVIAFLVLFTLLAYGLKRAVWRRVH